MILMKQLEGKRRNDDREKRREDVRLERERERERRVEQKKLENEIIAEMRKPVEDMSLPQVATASSSDTPSQESQQQQEEAKRHVLPELPRIPELLLSGEAFANTLMVYEFLHNFGERLGFGK